MKPAEEEKEEWRYVPDFGRQYSVSNLGRVRTHWYPSGPRFLKTYGNRRGRCWVPYVKLGKQGYWSVAALVLTAFVGPRPFRHFALRKNRIATDNRLSNLFWGTREDLQHQQRIVGRTKGHHNSGKPDLRALVPQILERLRKKENPVVIAAELGVHRSTINRIKNGKRHAALRKA